MASKYLDITGLSYYNQKIKSYIDAHAGGSTLYLHKISVVDSNETSYWQIITNSNTPINSFSSFVNSITNNLFNVYGLVYDPSEDDSNIILAVRDISSLLINIIALNVNDTINARSWTTTTPLTFTDTVVKV